MCHPAAEPYVCAQGLPPVYQMTAKTTKPQIRKTAKTVACLETSTVAGTPMRRNIFYMQGTLNAAARNANLQQHKNTATQIAHFSPATRELCAACAFQATGAA